MQFFIIKQHENEKKKNLTQTNNTASNGNRWSRAQHTRSHHNAHSNNVYHAGVLAFGRPCTPCSATALLGLVEKLRSYVALSRQPNDLQGRAVAALMLLVCLCGHCRPPQHSTLCALSTDWWFGARICTKYCTSFCCSLPCATQRHCEHWSPSCTRKPFWSTWGSFWWRDSMESFDPANRSQTYACCNQECM